MLSFIVKKNYRALVALGTVFCLLVIGGCATNKTNDYESTAITKISNQQIRAAEQEQCWKERGFTKQEMKAWLDADTGFGFGRRNCISQEYIVDGQQWDYVNLVVSRLKKIGVTPSEAKLWKMAGLDTYFNSNFHSSDPNKRKIFDISNPNSNYVNHMINLGYTPESFAKFLPIITENHKGNYLERINSKKYNSVEEVAVNEFPFKNTFEYKSAFAINKKKRDEILAINKKKRDETQFIINKDKKDILAAKKIFMMEKGNLKVGYLVCNSLNIIAFVDRISGDRVKLDLKAQGEIFHRNTPGSYVKKMRPYELFRTNLPSFKYNSLKGQTWDSANAWALCDLNTPF